MQIARTIEEVRAFVRDARSKSLTVGFVPTMGYFHEGHLSLMREASKQCDLVVVSLFVNPTQFAPTEDLTAYPRDFDRDCQMAENVGVNLMFTPAPAEMYPAGYQTIVTVDTVSMPMEGIFRPSHFSGVASVVCKLFNIVQPDKAFFGMKDYQQLKVIQRMVADLNMPVEVVPCPTVREQQGLAMSSRNTYLSDEQKQTALVISWALAQAKERAEASPDTDPEQLRADVQNVIKSEPGVVSIDYVTICHPELLTPIDDFTNGAVICVACRVGKTRLIDNIVINSSH
ncbi:MAG: pantoate--beta-alanine ligase [Armatimonadota bacterium]